MTKILGRQQTNGSWINLNKSMKLTTKPQRHLLNYADHVLLLTKHVGSQQALLITMLSDKDD